MSDTRKVLVRNAREQDIPAVVEINAEAAVAEKAEIFQLRLTAFPNGFVVLIAENEIAAFGCGEKWLAEDEPGLAIRVPGTHQPDGRIFRITTLAVKKKYRGRGYRLLVLDKLMEIAHLEGCKKVVVETAEAQDLYLQRGFKTVQQRTERGIALDVMARELDHIRML